MRSATAGTSAAVTASEEKRRRLEAQRRDADAPYRESGGEDDGQGEQSIGREEIEHGAHPSPAAG